MEDSNTENDSGADQERDHFLGSFKTKKIWVEPKDKVEFEEEWMRKMKKELLSWLKSAKNRARDKNVASELEKFTRNCDSSWKKYEPLCDIQTGKIYDPVKQKELQTLVEKEQEDRSQIYAKHEVYFKELDFMLAQSAWEDFLYYQNAWNRRFGKNPATKDLYDVTDAEMKEKDEMRAVAQQLGKVEGQTRRDPRKAPPYGRVLEEGDQFEKHYAVWRNHIISVFRKFKLGYRQETPNRVGPQTAHRYSQTVRNSSRMTTPDYLKRKTHLNDRFPPQRRIPFIPGNVEEIHTDPWFTDILKYAKPNQLVPNDAQPDVKRFQALRESYERKQSKSSIASLRENGHVLHHGFTESSWDWPTSYESRDWGNEFAIVGVKRTPVFQEEENQEEENAPASTSTQVRYKLDQNKNPIPKVDTQKRYKMKSTSKPSQVFHLQTNNDGTVAGRDRRLRWRGTLGDGVVFVEDFELDEKNQRIPLDSLPIQRIEYSTAIVTPGSPPLTRRERLEQQYLQYEHSEDEDASFVPLDPNWSRSGNMKINASEVEEGSGGEAEDGPSGDSDSDSDRDLFRQSYKKAVSTRKAKALQQSIRQDAEQSEQYPHFRLSTAVEALTRGLPEELLRAEWQAQLDIWNSR
ncbi:hypothetical protein IQ07DRAFT_503141 [Pyrenochaeta sp. DS3sAY3a]|nr:hypothetical protein IQ07DRAFT_503141 [Pyrenochaeta sp. DS3sAY3a]